MPTVEPKNAKRNHQRGQSIVEISLITPLLLIAMYIPMDFGVSFFMGNLTQTAAREGARIGSGLQKSGEVPNLIFSSAHAETVKTEVFSRLPSYLANKQVTVTFYKFSLYKVMRLAGANAPDSLTISRTTQMHYKYQPYTNSDYCTTANTYGPYSS
jgi:Flp pilus assembly protein TadG